MDIKTLLNNLHKELSCSVCLITFTDPKQLPCLHSFCLHCLNEILRMSGRKDIITCPDCRGESRVPSSGNLKDLPTNFRINSWLDVLAIKDCNTTVVKCGNCDKKSAHSLYCFHCCAFWCDDCISAHNIIRANKDHRVLAIKDLHDRDIEDVLKRPAFCGKPGHGKKELEFFCRNCEEPICNSCATTIHDGHVKILLEEAANERIAEAQSMIECQKQKAEQIRNKIFLRNEICAKIHEEIANVKRSAQQFADNMIVVIEAKKEEIFNAAENQGKQSLEQLGIQKSDIEQQAQIIETGVEKAEALLERSTSSEIAQLDKSLKTIFREEVKHEGEHIDCDLEGLRRFIFEENEKLLEKATAEGIGSFKTFLSKTEAQQSNAKGSGISEVIVGLETQFVLTTRNAEGEQCYEAHDCLTVKMRNRQGQDCATKARVKDNQDGSYRISYFAKETGRYHLSVKINEEHVHGSPFALQVKPRQFRPVSSFGQRGSGAGMLFCPWGVAVNERNEIAVTDALNHRIQVFSSDGTYLRSFGREGDKQGEFDFPAGIAFDPKNGNILVSDRNNCRVQLFNEQGEYVNQFGGKGNLDHQLQFPGGLSVDSDCNVIVADWGNKVIKIFSHNGHFLRKIGEKGSFNRPWHCVQYDNYLIVSDRGEDCIKVFNKDGTFLYKFGKGGSGDGEFNQPRCLSVNKAGHLMVCDRENHRVQVFELSGKFMAKFGTKGRGIGEFNGLSSTAVLSDGRIVVSDFAKDRIQIFE
ncbi:E3 ubiquitin-protein ligase TRIM71-like [Orbicella faveolata]|uniref:E3 ubiquitin-protein ligase TRIM71-like n=1 Tax=Orbicella faveolata TaxID=48498 RepID=UPI0009E63412|nr:E3 ubiquitin-protein ligase TRIM71-like [Orbicella faveolata]